MTITITSIFQLRNIGVFMKQRRLLMVVLLIVSQCCAFTYAQTEKQSTEQKPGKLLPSEAVTLMIKAVDTNQQKKRRDNTRRFLPRVITKGLSEEEQFYLGEVYFWGLKPKEALKAYEPILKNRGKFGRAAWQRNMVVLFRGFNEFDKVEAQLKEYRKLFKPSPSDNAHLYGPVFLVANRYKTAGNHQKVIELISDEISEFNDNGAYISYQLPIRFIDSYKAVGKKDEALKILQTAKEKLVRTLAERKKNIPKNDIKYAVHSPPVLRMETVATEQLGYSQRNEAYSRLIKRLEDGMKKIRAEK